MADKADAVNRTITEHYERQRSEATIIVNGYTSLRSVLRFPSFAATKDLLLVGESQLTAAEIIRRLFIFQYSLFI